MPGMAKLLAVSSAPRRCGRLTVVVGGGLVAQDVGDTHERPATRE